MGKNFAPLEELHESSITMQGLLEGGIASQELVVLNAFIRGLSTTLEDKIEKLRNGSPLLGTHFAFPSEIFAVFDVVPICFESLSYIKSAMFAEGTEKYYDKATAWGHPYHTCSSQKGVMGMALERDYLDIDLIAIPTAPCDNTVASYQWFSEVKDIPLFVADMPYYHDERGVNYYAGELKRMIEDLGEFLGQEPDYKRLKQAISYSSNAIKYQGEINDLRAAKPCPVESMFNPVGACVQNFFAGREEKEIFYREVLEDAKKKVTNGQFAGGGGLAEEKIRSYWPYMSIFFEIELCEWLERDLGMSIVSDVFNHFFFDPIPANASIDEMVRGLALQSMEYPMIRQGETFANLFLEDSLFLAQKFQAECAIFTAHIGCKQSLSVIELIREALREELGIPMLTLELDIGDKRMTSIETIKKKISEFTQTLM